MFLPPFGDIKTIRPADPAAGAELSVPVPANKIWRIHSITLTLTTDANVADRYPIFAFLDGADMIWRIWYRTAHPASTVVSYHFALVGDDNAAPYLNNAFASAPFPMWFRGGETFDTLFTTLQVGDQISDAALNVEEWIIE